MGELRAVPLSELGLLTGEEAARRKGCDATTVRRWAAAGLIPVVVVGSGRSAKYLYRLKDVEAFEPRPVGAPAGNTNAVKEKPDPAPKPGKTRAPKKSRKKSPNP